MLSHEIVRSINLVFKLMEAIGSGEIVWYGCDVYISGIGRTMMIPYYSDGEVRS